MKTEKLTLHGHINKALASALYLGCIPIMPGTLGALWGFPIYYGLWKTLPSEYLQGGLAIAVILLCWLNHYLTPWAEKYWNAQDPGQFVIDEIVGFLVVPIIYGADNFYQTAVYGFILFRVFDIIKIPPANIVDKRMKNSTGIVLDDIISGIYAALVLFLCDYFAIQLP